MAIFLGVPAWSDAVRFWLETAKTTPSWAANVAPIITNQFFPAGLAIFGFVYLAIVGYEGSDIVRHKIVPVVGSIVVGICFLSILLAAGAGYFELRVREEGNKIALGIPRNTPDNISPQNPQKPLFSGNSGHDLTPDQTRILILELSKLKGSLTTFPIAITTNDFETGNTQRVYADILRRAGIAVDEFSEIPSGPEDEGLIFQVQDPNNMPVIAHKVLEAFAIANIFPTIRQYPANVGQRTNPFSLFIAPRPIQWH